MRPIPEHSTDIAYSPFPPADMEEMARALNAGNINVVTTACLDPQRVLYHSSVNNVQARLKNGSWEEDIQGRLIADRADVLYERTLPDYRRALEASLPDMQRKQSMLTAFIEQLKPEEALPWDPAGFDRRWDATDTKRFPFRWERKALETYRQVRNNIADGTYVPAPGWDALKATHWWGERNLEYKHYRDLSRTLINANLEAGFSPDAFLDYKPTKDRTTVIVTSGMGGGKSWFTGNYLKTLPSEERSNLILHDADYMKLAFARSAQRDGKITRYTGPEVHNESSIALYENAIKRRYFACRSGKAPEVIVNSTIAGSFEVEDGLEGGGKVVVHHISIDYENALHAVQARAATLGRAPDADAVRHSVRASPRNLLELFGKYAGKPVEVHLYERTDSAPQAFGTMDVQHKTVTINDTEAFLRMAARAELKPQRRDAQKAYIKALQDYGVSITCTSKGAPPAALWTLSPEGCLTASPGTELPQQIRTLLQAATQQAASRINNASGEKRSKGL